MNDRMTLAAAALLSLSLLAPAPGASAGADDGLYRDLGGKQGIRNIVATLIPMVLADARIKDSFADSDMQHVGKRLEEQLCALAGGPCTYGGEPMKESHGGLKITNAQFNALTEDLQLAMEQHGVANAAGNRLVAKLAPMQREIVTK
ncbi:group I truncated hemoglobin [Massilia sp. PWRC2]|uniref:group I truncated hemoglobin n=1 Tax=Massilia sp. PWRC2 TaxID=2804626 RepID=UPI003CE69C48